ncbi:hypothetical protein ACV1EB_16595 [Aeromonas caviae]|uniref:hypothetical protein n=1 Tax=Aeromonas TaxID=642 RepID=UPI001B3430FB|nr:MULTISPECIES: hypothetical protein [unclassified Aeromonas]MBP4068493.1 hypothetical protein [Aeromonas sp. MaB10011B]MBP4082223.1 hypothetical protein [Aeromonas sp. MrichA-1]
MMSSKIEEIGALCAGHFDPEPAGFYEEATALNSSLHKALMLRSLNGSDHRSITDTRPNIFPPIVHPKKDVGTQEFKGWFAEKKSYCFNDHLTCGFLELAKLSKQNKQEIQMLSVTFNDETNEWLRAVDARPHASRTMIQTLTRSIMDNGWTTDSIVVIEESKDDVELTVGSLKGLHMHILTYGDEAAIKRLKAILRLYGDRVHAESTWKDKRPYGELDELEEEQFGEMPVGAVDEHAAHWIGQYKKTKENGKIIVYIERPVCLRSADYLSKTLNTNIGRGRNFKFIGLEGAKTRRRDMIKRAKEYRNQR